MEALQQADLPSNGYRKSCDPDLTPVLGYNNKRHVYKQRPSEEEILPYLRAVADNLPDNYKRSKSSSKVVPDDR